MEADVAAFSIASVTASDNPISSKSINDSNSIYSTTVACKN